jgi:hypothetical protein
MDIVPDDLASCAHNRSGCVIESYFIVLNSPIESRLSGCAPGETMVSHDTESRRFFKNQVADCHAVSQRPDKGVVYESTRNDESIRYRGLDFVSRRIVCDVDCVIRIIKKNFPGARESRDKTRNSRVSLKNTLSG